LALAGGRSDPAAAACYDHSLAQQPTHAKIPRALKDINWPAFPGITIFPAQQNREFYQPKLKS